MQLLASHLAGKWSTGSGAKTPLVNPATEEVLAAPQPEIVELLSHVSASGPGADRRMTFWNDRAAKH